MIREESLGAREKFVLKINGKENLYCDQSLQMSGRMRTEKELIEFGN